MIHRAEAGDWADAWRLAGDMSFVEAKCRELGVHEAEVDIARIAERCRASDDAAIARRLGDLARALGRDSHWFSADELDEQLRGVDDAGFLRVRHAVTRESPALVRDLVGHAKSVRACTVTPDGQRVVSASDDRTLKVWDLETYVCLLTHRGDAPYAAVATTATTIVAGDTTGGCGFSTGRHHPRATEADAHPCGVDRARWTTRVPAAPRGGAPVQRRNAR